MELVARLKVATNGSRHRDCPLAFGGRVVVASPQQAPWVFDLEDGALVGRLQLGGEFELRTLAVSARGELLALTEDGTARVSSPPVGGARPKNR